MRQRVGLLLAMGSPHSLPVHRRTEVAMRLRAFALLVFLVAATKAQGQPQDGAWDFWLSKDLVEKLATENTLFFPMRLRMEARSGVHGLSSDCEMHIAGTPVDAVDKAAPPSVVVEPPNLCKNKPLGGGSWNKFFDNHVIDETCEVTGFPRIYDEHLQGDETKTNPHHMLEIHPAMSITCGGTTVDFRSFLAYHDGMAEIKPTSAASCFDTHLWARRNDAKNRYEFETDRKKTCGNFASFEMSIFTEWIRELSNGGHSAIARVSPEGMGPETLKIYTYPGTAEDTLLASKMASTDPHFGTYLHGMMSFDYFSIVKALRTQQGDWIDFDGWKEVAFPLALVVFGSKEDPDPEE